MTIFFSFDQQYNNNNNQAFYSQASWGRLGLTNNIQQQQQPSLLVPSKLG
jgi:hypothetical protein